MPDDFDLDELSRLHEAATPGPWVWEAEGFMGCGQVWTNGEGVEGGSIAAPSGDCYPRSGYNPKADMQLIAAVRNELPKLIDRVRIQAGSLTQGAREIAELRAENARLTTELAAAKARHERNLRDQDAKSRLMAIDSQELRAEVKRLTDGITALADELEKRAAPKELPVDYALENVADKLRALLGLGEL